MKLIRLKILEEFRGLKPAGLEVNFHNKEASDELSKFHPFCLVGLNGSGKSNVLEALANIFYHLECCINDYPKSSFNRKESSPNAYELEYFIANSPENKKIEELNRIKITKTLTNAPTMSINGADPIEVRKGSGSSFLPDLVVAYSSGENETLSLPFVKMKLFQYDEYLKDFIGKSVYEKPKSSLLYIDYEMSQAVLLTTLLFFNDDVLKPLEDEMGILGIQQFTINLKNNWQKIIRNDEPQIQVHTISEDNYALDKDKSKYPGRILDHLNKQIKKLKACSTCTFIEDNYMSLDYWVDKNTKTRIRKEFDNDPYKFFSVFQMLQALNERVEDISEKKEIYDSKGYYTDYKRPEYSWFFNFTNYFVKQKQNNTGKIENLLLKQLSDGEQQFLHTLGICLLLQKKRTLLLLDEPETHFNPDWRSKFINILRKSLETGGDDFLMKDIILTSHSPFIISDCLPDKVIIFERGKQPKTASEMDIDTFGTSVNLLTNKIFKKKNTIGDYSLEKIEDFRNKAKKVDIDIDSLIQEINSELGDSLEKLLLIKEITNSKL